MTPSPQLESFTKGWERCRLIPYKDIAGNWTVGWGHLMQPNDPHVPMSQDEADSLFTYQILHIGDGVGDLLKIPVSQQQFDALVDFAYNCGVGALAASTLLTSINDADFAMAASKFGAWNKARNPQTGILEDSEGLTKRRAAEVAIFVNGDYSGRP